MREETEQYKEIIASGTDTFLLVGRGEILRRMSGPGVRPMLQCYTNEPGLMRDGMIFDKVIGKAAAMIAVLGGVRFVYGQVMSRPGLDYLRDHGIEAQWDELVPYIENRTGDDLCPLEKSVRNVDDPYEGIEAIRATVAKLMAGK